MEQELDRAVDQLRESVGFSKVENETRLDDLMSDKLKGMFAAEFSKVKKLFDESILPMDELRKRMGLASKGVKKVVGYTKDEAKARWRTVGTNGLIRYSAGMLETPHERSNREAYWKSLGAKIRKGARV